MWAPRLARAPATQNEIQASTLKFETAQNTAGIVTFGHLFTEGQQNPLLVVSGNIKGRRTPHLLEGLQYHLLPVEHGLALVRCDVDVKAARHTTFASVSHILRMLDSIRVHIPQARLLRYVAPRSMVHRRIDIIQLCTEKVHNSH